MYKPKCSAININNIRCAALRSSDNKKCTMKVSHNNIYCKYHASINSDIKSNKNKCEQKIKDPCAICLEEVDQKDDMELECKHTFHQDCLKQLHDNACPICRQPLISNKLTQKDIEIIEERKIKDKEERQHTLNINAINELTNAGIIADNDALNIMNAGDLLWVLANIIAIPPVPTRRRRLPIIMQVDTIYNDILDEIRGQLSYYYQDTIYQIIEAVTYGINALGRENERLEYLDHLYDRLCQDIPILYPEQNIEEICQAVQVAICEY